MQPEASEEDVELFKLARQALEDAYVPYSDYPVGAAVRTEGGTTFVGSNVENASYGLSMCAERVAIFKAVSEGYQDLGSLAIATGGERHAPPCGACRQVMREFNPDFRLVYGRDPDSLTVRSLSELLPDSFGPDALD